MMDCIPVEGWFSKKSKDAGSTGMSNLFYYTGELGFDRPNGTRKIGSLYAKSVVYI